jgi:hypothetical protein
MSGWSRFCFFEFFATFIVEGKPILYHFAFWLRLEFSPFGQCHLFLDEQGFRHKKSRGELKKKKKKNCFEFY